MKTNFNKYNDIIPRYTWRPLYERERSVDRFIKSVETIDSLIMRRMPISLNIKQIYVNEKKRATTVLWDDGAVTTVKAAEDAEFDVYSAVTAALAERVYGSNSAFKRILKDKVVEQGKKGRK